MKRFYSVKLATLITVLLGLNWNLNAQTSTYAIPGVFTYTVPTCTYSLGVVANGAQGGLFTCCFSTTSTNGKGGRVACNLNVTPGQVLNIFVGGIGTNGNAVGGSTALGGFNGGGDAYGDPAYSGQNGGAGGGASDIRIGGTALANRVIVAGGGGGEGANGSVVAGGIGGGLTGGAGGASGGVGGGGGTQAAGGVGAQISTTYTRGQDGSLGLGGSSVAPHDGLSGAGGGGYYGGGAGSWAGGGGGSSYTDPAFVPVGSVTHTQGVNSTNGSVAITPLCNPPGTIVSSGTSVCQGSTLTFTNPTGASVGTWSSSNTSIATISTSGVLTALAPGTTTITYNVCNACSALSSVSIVVNAAPTPILGASSVCTGNTVSLSSTPAGGTWTSSSTGSATVNSSGTVGGVSAGIPNITYTLPGGCNTFTPITINATPSPLTGNTTICGTGATTTLNEISTGGTWASSFTTVASVSGVVGTTATITGGFPGISTITYSFSSGCFVNTTVTVNSLTVFTVTGGGAYCSGGSSVYHIVLNGSTPGITYRLYNGITPASPVTPGTGSPLDFGLIAASGLYTVIATDPSNGCSMTMSGSATIAVNPLPSIYPVSYPGTSSSYCAGGTGVHILLGNSEAGVNYQLYNGSFPVTAMSGTGSALDFGARPAGTYTIVASNALTICTVNMAGSVTVVTNPLPVVDTVTGSGSYCADVSGRNVGLDYSSPGTNYTLYSGASAIATAGGSGSSLDFGVQPVGTYTVSATNPATGCSAGMYGKAIITSNPLPDIHNVTVTNDGIYCAGGTGVHVGVDLSNTGINYLLYSSGVPTGTSLSGTGAALDFGLRTAGTYTVRATNAVTGCTAFMSNSVAVNTVPLPVVYAVSGGGHYCQGGTGVEVVLLGSEEEGMNYQLYRDGIAVGPAFPGTGGIINFGNQTDAGNYTVVASDPGHGCSRNMSGSANVFIDPLPTAFTVTGGGGYCQGGTGRHVGLSFSGVGVRYWLYYNVSTLIDSADGTGSGLDFGLQTSPGVYTVVAANMATGCMKNMDGNAVVAINPLPNNSYMVLPLNGSLCAGGAGIDITTTNSAMGVNYQLYRGATAVGSPIAGTGNGEDPGPLDFGVQTTAGVYTVMATNAVTGCISQLTGTTTITVNPLPPLYVVGGGGSFCTGGTGVNITMSGSTPGISYQLYNGASPVGGPLTTGGGAVNFGTFIDAGTYTVIATNGSTGCTQNMSGSALVNVLPLPGAFNVTGGGGYCTGDPGRHVGLDGSQAGIHYQLYDDGIPSGPAMTGSGIALDFGLRTVAGDYTVVATNPATTCSSNMTESVSININPLPTVYITGGGGSYCEFGPGVHVNLSSSDGGIRYRLFVGGIGGTTIIAPEGGGPLDFGAQTTPGVYTIVATNDGTGCSNTMASTAVVTMISLNTYTVIGGGPYCEDGTGVHIGLSGSASGISYQLYYGATAMGDPVIGTGSALDFGLFIGAGTYTVIATDIPHGCTKNMAGSATIIVNALPEAHAVTGGGRYCSGGVGEHVGLDGSDAGIRYQLYRGAILAGPPVTSIGGGSLDFGLQTAAGTYTVIATDPLTTCARNMSDNAVINVLPTPIPYPVTVDNFGNYCAADSGLHIHLPNSQAGITYQLYRGITPVGGVLAGTGSALDFGLQSVAGIYTISAMDTTATCSNNMAGSASIYIVPLPIVHLVTGGGVVCPGAPGLEVGLDNSQAGIIYQLYRGTAPVGSPLLGTGVMLDFGIQPPGVYKVVGNSTITECPNDMFGTAEIKEDSLWLPSISLKAYPGLSIGVWHIDSMQVIFTNGGANPTFQWLINGIPVAGATSATFTHHEFFNGDSVSVMVTAGGPCGGLTAAKGLFLRLFNVGVNHVTVAGTEVKLVPNPNKGVFNLKGSIGGAKDEEITLEITNMLGQVIYTNKVMTRNGAIDEHIQLKRDLSNGMYLMNIRSASQNNVIHFVIEQ